MVGALQIAEKLPPSTGGVQRRRTMSINVIIHGQTTQDFRIVVSDEHGNEEFIISEMLVVDESDLEREVRECSAQEHFWSQLAIDAELAKDRFEKIDYAQYMAHIEKYAKYYLKGSGEKNPTVAAKENAAVLIFSKNANQDEYAEIAYKGYVAEVSGIGLTPKSAEEFKEEMYIYAPSYEDAQTHLLSLQHKTRQLKAISAAFNNKIWSIRTLAADRRATLQSNIN